MIIVLKYHPDASLHRQPSNWWRFHRLFNFSVHKLMNFLQFVISHTWISIEFVDGVYFPFILFKIINVFTCLLGSKVKSVSNTVYLDKNIVQLLQLYPKTIMASSHDSCPICFKFYNPPVVIPLYRAFSFRHSQRASLMPAGVQLTILLFPRNEVLAEPVSELT